MCPQENHSPQKCKTCGKLFNGHNSDQCLPCMLFKCMANQTSSKPAKSKSKEQPQYNKQKNLEAPEAKIRKSAKNNASSKKSKTKKYAHPVRTTFKSAAVVRITGTRTCDLCGAEIEMGKMHLHLESAHGQRSPMHPVINQYKPNKWVSWCSGGAPGLGKNK